jgi:hypothetical protein
VNKALQPGDAVEWETSQGKTKGVVKKKLISRSRIKTHVVAATKDAPQYLVESEKSGRVAAHKQSALKKRSK